jgi:endonuclease/exonuclease/phosphatase family metal-dependent hydrolase
MTQLTLLTWNVNGRTEEAAERQIAEVIDIDPDVVALQEITGGSVDRWRDSLLGSGYSVLTSDLELLKASGPFMPHTGSRFKKRKNLNLIASKHPIASLPGLSLDDPIEGFPEKYLAARIAIDGAAIDVHDVHTPPGASVKMLKVDYWEAMLRRINEPTGAARVLCGDFNSPWSEDDGGTFGFPDRTDDEDGQRWTKAELGFLDHPEMRDIYLAQHRRGQPFPISYFRGHHGTGECRYDRIYGSPEFDHELCRCEYRTDLLRAGLSDHAPVVAKLQLV